MSENSTPSEISSGFLVGCGRMGLRHIKYLNASQQIKKFCIIDPFIDESSISSAKCVGVYKNLDSALNGDNPMIPKWGIIATPTPLHFDVAIKLLEKGIPLLVEKPLAPTSAQCNKLLEASKANQAPLFVGHTERFNPTVSALKQFLSSEIAGQVQSIHITRWGPAPAEVMKGNNVVVDLTVHDIDILHSLGFSIELVNALRKESSGYTDHLEATLKLNNDTPCTISTSWRSQARSRIIKVLFNEGILTADLMGQKFHWEGDQTITPPNVVSAEPLGEQLDSFLSALSDVPSSLCTGEEGSRAVELAELILKY